MSEEKERVARCLCGRLVATVQGDPVRVYGCACFECQRRTGSVFTYNALFSESAVTIAGEFRSFRRISDAGFWVESNFCPNCGSSVFNRGETRMGLIGIAVGTFNDPGFQAPKVIAWVSRRHGWMVLPDGIKTLDTQ